MESSPAITVSSQYVKDLSFEGPKDIRALRLKKSQPEVKIGFDVKVDFSDQEGSADVSLFFHLESYIENEKIFILELVYVGEMGIRGFDLEKSKEILFTGGATLLFPFARQIIAQTVSTAGFTPILLDYINFVEFYRTKSDQTSLN